MPWYAQVPGGWPFWADPGTMYEQVLLRLDYGLTRAPGAEPVDEHPEPATDQVATDEVPADEPEPEPPVRASPRTK